MDSLAMYVFAFFILVITWPGCAPPIKQVCIAQKCKKSGPIKVSNSEPKQTGITNQSNVDTKKHVSKVSFLKNITL